MLSGNYIVEAEIEVLEANCSTEFLIRWLNSFCPEDVVWELHGGQVCGKAYIEIVRECLRRRGVEGY